MLNKNKANHINPLANDMLKNSVLMCKVMALFINSKRGSLTHRKAINQLSEQHGMKMCTPEGKKAKLIQNVTFTSVEAPEVLFSLQHRS